MEIGRIAATSRKASALRRISLLLLSALLLLPTAAHATGTATSNGASNGASSQSRLSAVRTVTYPGLGAEVKLDQLDRISDTSPEFQAFVERRLTRLWQDNDPREKCRSAATVIVKTWRSDGYAMISDMGNFSPCPAGGWVQIAVQDDDGRWRAPVRLGSHEPFSCKVLDRFDVPPPVVTVGRCFAGPRLVSYRRWLASR